MKIRFKINKKAAYFVLVLVGLITTFATYQTLKLKFSYNIENFFTKSDADYKFYKKYTERFGGENNFVLVGIENKQGIDNLEFFKKLNVLTHFLEKIGRASCRERV